MVIPAKAGIHQPAAPAAERIGPGLRRDEHRLTPMFAYIIRRILATIPVMTVVAIFVFGLLYLSPGDPAAIIAGDSATSADIARIHAKLGLDRPFYVQFATWVWALLHGDLGISIFTNLPVLKLIGQRVEPTAALTVSTLIISVSVAIPLGVLAAAKAGTWIDRAVMVFAVIGFSVPVFVLAYILIYIFSIEADVLPVQGYVSLSEGLRPFLSHLVMPTIALGAVYIALIARITRASMLDVLSQDYIRTAQAKGLSNENVLIVHALRNAAVPIATVIGIGVAVLIGGVVVTETVFAIPGLGRLTVDAILRRDYPIIQGIILIFSGIYVLINLLVDLSYAVLDPRIRY
jgi:peptide/nickel transport system permease protein